ncbi:MAG: hypothetical protein AB8G22_21370 [Saprospiraceae bacterium]
MSNPQTDIETIKALLRPETDLEHIILQQPDFQRGLHWGLPRFGHPEGKILYHIREVLDNVEKLNISSDMSRQLRLITFVHDTFKNIEHKGKPRDWTRHHAVLARKFMEQFTDEKAVLDVIELHDEAYYSWRYQYLYKNKEKGERRLARLLEKIGDNMQLYYLFFKCDTRTGDKIQTPLQWFEANIKNIEIVDF